MFPLRAPPTNWGPIRSHGSFASKCTSKPSQHQGDDSQVPQLSWLLVGKNWQWLRNWTSEADCAKKNYWILTNGLTELSRPKCTSKPSQDHCDAGDSNDDDDRADHDDDQCDDGDW